MKTPLYLKFIVAIVSVFIFLIITETTLRVVDPQLEFKNQFFPVNRDIDFPEFYEKDAQLYWKLRAGKKLESKWFSELSYKINSYGFRGPEINKEKSGLRVLALGNSCTFGWGVPFEDCWTNLLEQKLKQSGAEKTEVINAGVPGYSSYQGKIMMNKLLPFKPDIVLIMFGWNDHWRAGKDISDAEQSPPPGIVLTLQNTFSKLRLYKLIRQVTLNLTEDTAFVRMDDISGKRRVSKEEFQENLKEIISIARNRKIKPVLLVPPIASLTNYELGSSSNLHLIHYRYQEQVKRISEYMNVSVVDLQLEFDKYDDLFDDPISDPIHFNSRGHKITADAIINSLDSVLQENSLAQSN